MWDEIGLLVSCLSPEIFKGLKLCEMYILLFRRMKNCRPAASRLKWGSAGSRRFLSECWNLHFIWHESFQVSSGKKGKISRATDGRPIT